MKQTYTPMLRLSATALLLAAAMQLSAHQHDDDKIRALQEVTASVSGFEENKGQLTDQENQPVPFVLYKAGARGIDLYLTEYGMTFVLLNKEHKEENGHHASTPVTYARIDMKLPGATISRANITAENPSADFSNYYYPHCPKGITGVRKYGKITVRNIYPGIDWVWHSDGKQGMKYDFVVHPGADPSRLRMEYSWADISTDESKQHLHLFTPEGELVEGMLRTFSGTAEVASAYVVNDKTVTFKIGPYDKTKDLVIDPPLANLWGTYFGGSTWEKNTDIKHDIDAQGNIFATCNTISTTFPTVNPGGGAYFDGSYGGGLAGIQGKGGDVAMMKFSNTGVLLWSTYVGGTSDDNGVAIACDANNEVWATGCSMSTNFPTLAWGSAYYQNTFGGGATSTYEGGDAIMMKFDNNGVMQWSTYVGGSASEMAFSMDNDPSGNIWVTGRTASANFPLQNIGGSAYYQGTLGGLEDAFVLKFSNLGALQHSTFYGGSDFDHGEFLICDNAGDVFITGSTASTNFPLMNMGNGAYYQATHGGTGGTGWNAFYYRGDYGDAYVLRFANTFQQKWGTFIGGNDNDAGRGLTINPSGQLYVIGDTKSPNFPVMQGTGYYQSSINGTGSNSSEDAFIAVFSPTGVQQHTTFFGSTAMDRGGAIVADNCGHIYATGHTTSTTLPTVDPGNGAYYISALIQSDDCWFMQLDNSNNMTWMTYNGSSGFDEKGTSLRVDPSGNLFATGYWCFYSTSNGCYNPGGGAYYKTNIDADDFFIMKFQAAAGGTLASNLNPSNATCNNACDGSITASGSGSCFLPYTYLWSTGDTTASISGLCPGAYTVIITDANGDTVMATVTITQPPPVTATVNGNLNIVEGDSTTLTASGGVTYLWSDSSTTSSITVNPTVTTSYSVIVFDANGCSDTITVTVTVDPDNPIYIWIPNVFTPNGDNNNDEFLITNIGFTELHLWIYNRWGQLVHESHTLPLKWNGINLQNKHASDGTYYWVVKGVQIDNEIYENTGFLTLIDGSH